jgi:hypothetical protein
MGYGMTSALQIGAIALVAGFVFFGLWHAAGRRAGWSHGKQIFLAYLFTVVIVGGEDLWNLFYFNFAPLESLQLLRLKLAAVHDPDAMGLRAFFVFIGATAGVGLGWTVFTGDLRQRFAQMRRPHS